MFECTVQEEVATVTMRNPPVNALSREWAEGFNAILDDLEQREDWRILLVRSGLRLFSAGGDIKQFASRLDEPDAGRQLAEEASIYQALFNRIERLPQVSIAQIQGVAAGGGLEIALACDLRIASATAKVGLLEVGLGLLPSAGGTQRMTRLCGAGRAMRLIGGAELIPASEALALGIVEWVLPEEAFEAEALAIVRRFVGQPREALQVAKSCITAALDPARDGFAEEIEAPNRLMGTSETREKINAFIAGAAAKSASRSG